MRRTLLISIDLALVAFATALAMMLRDNFEIDPDKVASLIAYNFLSLGVAFIVFLVGGLDRTLWQYSAVADYLQIMVLTALTVLIAVIIGFAFNRLTGVARSLPVLQGVLIASTLISARVAARAWFARQIHASNGKSPIDLPGEAVLVVGVNEVSELFLRSVQAFASRQIRVAGVLAEDPAVRGRTIQKKRILGTVEELRNVLGSLEVHGIAVDRIVVATSPEQLSSRSLEILLEVEQSSDIVVQFLSEMLGFGHNYRTPLDSDRERTVARSQRTLSLEETEPARSSFWSIKRIIDASVAVFLIVMLAPIVTLVALIVATDVGFPLIFWQQRPGLWGRPFKLYKFRTMAGLHDKYGRRIPDDRRLSAVGEILRRTRLDELPQLYNVLIGDMSFVGPRPLLPIDQSPNYAARLSVRPGITGWAQVNGGRIISPIEKAILDIWYINKASFVLDLKILLRTIHLLVFGDRPNSKVVHQARSDLDHLPALRSLLWTDAAGPAE